MPTNPKEYMAAWRASHPEKMQEYRARWNMEHPESRRQSRNAWRSKNPRKRARDHYRETYGVTLEDLETLFVKQQEGCAICHTPLSFPSRRAHVDHDHKTGEIRGILCRRCNQQLGHYEVWPEFSSFAELYLRGGYVD